MSEILNLAWLIPLFPFLAFVAIALFVSHNEKLSHRLALAGIGIAFVLSQIVFWVAVLIPVGGLEHAFHSATIPWLTSGGEPLRLGVWIDPATTVMLFMVPLVCMMIFIYSVGYMHGDPRYSRFFAYISLFATGMLGMVIFDNLLAFFLFWEIMGACSYLLIGFWYEKTSAYQAGLKAFLTTRVGDLFFLLGLALLYSYTGTLTYSEILDPETIHHLVETPFMGSSISVGALISLLLFGGTVGKSAQVPLHVWLPDAMEGPTPVSALIHAATMVSAGVFLVARTWPLMLAAFSPAAQTVLWIGAITAAFGAMIGAFQDDIKRVLAFSTISQLGYMIAALGLGAFAEDPVLQIGAYVAGVFHLITHAFFKALLFLGSGSVIHAMEHGHHHAHEEGHGAHEEGHGAHEEHEHAFDPNDMKNMGGLAKRMPRTFWTFLIGGLALSGFPLVTAGFWSKDEILAMAADINPAVFWVLAVSAGLTAFYTARQIAMTFLGEPRTSAAAHAPESVPSMTVPLMILAFFSVTLGWAGIPEAFPVLGSILPTNWVHFFLERTIEPYIHHGGGEHSAVGLLAAQLLEGGAVPHFNWVPLIIGLSFALGGLGLGFLVYAVWQPLTRADEVDPLERGMRRLRLGWLYDAFRNLLYFDELYHATFVRGSILLADLSYAFDHRVVDGVINLVGAAGRGLSEVAYWFDAHVVDYLVNLVGRAGRALSNVSDLFDQQVVDGAVNGVGSGVRWLGSVFRPIQTGKVQNYLLLASLMVLVLVATAFLFVTFVTF